MTALCKNKLDYYFQIAEKKNVNTKFTLQWCLCSKSELNYDFCFICHSKCV